MMWRKIQVLQYLISLIQQPLCLLTLLLVMSVMEFETKILTAFECVIRFSFLLIVTYHVMNTCTNFKLFPKICPLNVMWNCPYIPFLPSIVITDKDKVSKQYSSLHFTLKNCTDLSTLSLVVIQLPDTDIREQHIYIRTYTLFILEIYRVAIQLISSGKKSRI